MCLSTRQIAAEKIEPYLDEYTFRFNRRRSRHPGKIFFRLAQQVVATERTTYRTLVDSQKPPQ